MPLLPVPVPSLISSFITFLSGFIKELVSLAELANLTTVVRPGTAPVRTGTASARPGTAPLRTGTASARPGTAPLRPATKTDAI